MKALLSARVHNNILKLSVGPPWLLGQASGPLSIYEREAYTDLYSMIFTGAHSKM